MNIIFISTAILGALGFIFGAGLTYISYKFTAEIDPRQEKILEVLPGVNCGACGLASCANYAEKLIHGELISSGLCIPGGKDVAQKIAEILGIEDVHSGIKKTAIVICGGGKDDAINQFEYDGIATCKGANLVSLGPKSCKYGCLGYGDCIKVCSFDAIHMNNNNLPEINKNCTGCGMCVNECPKKVVTLVDTEHFVNILCNSNDKGVVVKQKCKKGCIACIRCVNVCPKQAIEIQNSLAFINYSKCDNCGNCVSVCPTNTIVNSKV